MVLTALGWMQKPFQIGTLQPHNVELETAIHKALSVCRFYVWIARALRNGYALLICKMETLIFAAWLCVSRALDKSRLFVLKPFSLCFVVLDYLWFCVGDGRGRGGQSLCHPSQISLHESYCGTLIPIRVSFLV